MKYEQEILSSSHDDLPCVVSGFSRMRLRNQPRKHEDTKRDGAMRAMKCEQEILSSSHDDLPYVVSGFSRTRLRNQPRKHEDTKHDGAMGTMKYKQEITAFRSLQGRLALVPQLPEVQSLANISTAHGLAVPLASIFGLLLNPEPCDLDVTGSGPYAVSNTPGTKDKGWVSCTAPRIGWTNILKAVAGAGNQRDGSLERGAMRNFLPYPLRESNPCVAGSSAHRHSSGADAVLTQYRDESCTKNR